MFPISFTMNELASAIRGDWLGKTPDGSDTVQAVFTDTRETAPDSVFFAFSGETFDAHNFLDQAVAHGAKVLVVERSKAEKVPAGVFALGVDSVLPAFQKLAAFHRDRFPNLLVLSLTGSCGKTSTKETLRAILEHVYGPEHVLATLGNTNNQIGVPQNLFRLTPEHKAAVLEMGTNHHGEIEPLARIVRPHGAMIVSIGNCHLEFLGSLEGVAKEKSHIFSHLDPDGIAVIPYESAGNQILREAAQKFTCRTFGTSANADMQVEYLGGNLHGASFRLTVSATGETAVVQWGVPGKHQACNAAGAAMLAYALGIPLPAIAEGIGKTVLPGMRMRITDHSGATWVNDAYNANPDSMKASLSWLTEFADPSKLVLVLGDMGELGDFSDDGHKSASELARALFPAARICLVGKKMSACLTGDSSVLRFDSSVAAAAGVRSIVRPGDLVFLKASRSTKLELVEPVEA